ncbi:MAG: hypothetical protein EA364_02595 [Balneolaceae bacterium]|nr:MAG: hypothetical protein EA364_02595 [Balneolaceae bacterium]
MYYMNFSKAIILKLNKVTNMLIILAVILSISSCSDSERNNNSSDWQKNSKEIQETYLSPRFVGFETADHFLIAQLQAANEINIDKLNQFNRIATGDDKILVLNDTEQFLFSITDETKIDLLVDGIILLTKNNNDVTILSEYIESLQDITGSDCWAGGEGTKSCSTMYRGPEIKVTCRLSFYACCNRDLTGLCIAN